MPAGGAQQAGQGPVEKFGYPAQDTQNVSELHGSQTQPYHQQQPYQYQQGSGEGYR